MATDNFTGSNGTELTTYSGSWATANALSSDFIIDTNALRTPFSRSSTLTAYYQGTFADDQYAQGTLVQIGSDNMFMGVAVRVSALGNAYTFYADTNSWVLAKLVGGSYTELDLDFVTINTNDVLYIEASGTTVTAKINGVTVSTVTDSSITSGNPGVTGNGSASSGTYTLLDNWTGADLAAAGQPAGVRGRGVPGMSDRQRFGRGW